MHRTVLQPADEEKLNSVLQSLGTENSEYAVAMYNHRYQEQAFLRLCRAVKQDANFDPIVDFGVLPALGGPKNSMPYRECGRRERSMRVVQVLKKNGGAATSYAEESAPKICSDVGAPTSHREAPKTHRNGSASMSHAEEGASKTQSDESALTSHDDESAPRTQHAASQQDAGRGVMEDGAQREIEHDSAGGNAAMAQQGHRQRGGRIRGRRKHRGRNQAEALRKIAVIRPQSHSME